MKTQKWHGGYRAEEGSSRHMKEEDNGGDEGE